MEKMTSLSLMDSSDPTHPLIYGGDILKTSLTNLGAIHIIKHHLVRDNLWLPLWQTRSTKLVQT